jgi:hypothetical protein
MEADSPDKEQRLKNLQTFKEQIYKAKAGIKAAETVSSPARSSLTDEEPPTTPLTLSMAKLTSAKVHSDLTIIISNGSYNP